MISHLGSFWGNFGKVIVNTVADDGKVEAESSLRECNSFSFSAEEKLVNEQKELS